MNMDRYRLLACDDYKGAMNWLPAALTLVDDFIDFDVRNDLIGSVKEVRELLESGNFNYDVVLTDINFEAEDPNGGFTILSSVKQYFPFTEVIIITAYTKQITIDRLLSVEKQYRISEHTWIRKEGSDEDIARSLADALRNIRPRLEESRLNRKSKERPYKIRLNEGSSSFTVIIPKSDQTFEVGGLDPRHLRIVALLAKSAHPIGEEDLINRLYSAGTIEKEDYISLAVYLSRNQMLDMADAINSPKNLCQQFLSNDGQTCKNYNNCFPSKRTNEARRIELTQCPLHIYFKYNLKRKKPKNIRVDISTIRDRVAKSVGNHSDLLAITGPNNDLLRTTPSGYFLSATIID